MREVIEMGSTTYDLAFGLFDHIRILEDDLDRYVKDHGNLIISQARLIGKVTDAKLALMRLKLVKTSQLEGQTIIDETLKLLEE